MPERLYRVNRSKTAHRAGAEQAPREVHISFFSANLPKGVRVPRLPYIGAALRAFAETNEIVKARYNFARLWDGRPSPEQLLAGVDKPFLFAFSCYVFNFDWTMHLARALKEVHPSCIIVVGGPHIPDEPGDFFQRYPHVDVAIHGEGEFPFRDLLLEYLNESPELGHVQSISYNVNGEAVTTPKGARLPQVLETPSPWTGGYLDSAIDEYRHRGDQVDVLWETNRGCPYSCSFCYWGTLETNKLRLVDMRRLKEEIDYFAQRRVDMVWICDANFGIHPRDKEIAKLLADAKGRTGYPRYVAAHHGKSTNDTIYDIIKIQRDAGQLYGSVWMARQSVSEEVLTAIKRPFAKGSAEKARAWKARFAKDGVPVKVDLILALPRETKESWFKGIGDLFRDGFHEDISIHYLSLLPNTPMASQIELHGLEIVRKPFRLLINHSEPSEVVVGTNTMPRETWVACAAMSQLILGTHLRGNATRYLSIYLQNECGLPYETFYQGLLTFAEAHPETFLGRLLFVLLESHRDFADPTKEASLSDSAGEFVPVGMEALFSRHPEIFAEMRRISVEREVGFGPDQYIQLAISANTTEFYQDLYRVIVELWPELVDDTLLEVLRFQQDLMFDVNDDTSREKQREYEHDWFNYLFSGAELRPKVTRIRFQDDTFDAEGTVNSFARRLVMARVGMSWFERERCSISFNPSTMDGKVASTARADRGSA